MEWVKVPNMGETYYKTAVFNESTYYLEAYIESTYKTEKIWFALSSGKKRKELYIFEEKERKSKGGIQALLWAKKEMLGFIDFALNPLNKKQYLCIRWADNRRRDIYARALMSEGFQFAVIEKEKVLIKKL